MQTSKAYLGIAALLLGIVALGLAIIPRAVFAVPPPWQEAEPQQAEPQTVIEGGKTLKWKDFEVNIGGTQRVVEPPPPPPPPASAKVVFIATAVVALAGIAAGVLSIWREKTFLLGGPAVALCCSALLWHYIMVGVMVAVGIIVLVMLLSAIGGAIS